MIKEKAEGFLKFMIYMIGKAVMAMIGLAVAFYAVVLLTAWLAPLIVFVLIIAGIVGAITILIKKKIH